MPIWQGCCHLPPGERDMLAHAVNERLDEVIAAHRVPYSGPSGSAARRPGPWPHW